MHQQVFDLVINAEDPSSIQSISLIKQDYDVLWKHVQEFLASDPTYDFRANEKFINEFLTWCFIWNNVMTLMDYKKILVVPSFKNSNYPSLWDDNNQKLPCNLVNNLWICVKQYFKSMGETFVCLPNSHGSFARNFLRSFSVNRIVCNEPYILGDDTFTIDPPKEWDSDEDVKFDAVFLAGIPAEGQTYNAADIKADFAQYCTDDFDLIDAYEGESCVNFFSNVVNNRELDEPETRLIGETKDLTNISHYINNCIHVDKSEEGFENLRYILPRLAEYIQKEFKIY